MNLSSQGLALLKKSEGFRPSIYRDQAGVDTIGYGHRVLEGESFPSNITEDQAEKILSLDILVAENSVRRLVKVSLTQGQFDALVDFVFNLGFSRLSKSTLLRYLNGGEYTAAGLELLKWDRVGEQEEPGLKARREAEFALWKGGSTT